MKPLESSAVTLPLVNIAVCVLEVDDSTVTAWPKDGGAIEAGTTFDEPPAWPPHAASPVEKNAHSAKRETCNLPTVLFLG